MQTFQVLMDGLKLKNIITDGVTQLVARYN